MKKEIIIAILVGLSLGLTIAFGVKTAQNSLKNHAKNTKNTSTFTNTQTTTNPDHTLFITSPSPDEIVSDADVNVVGSTSPNAMISIVGNNNIETSTLADETGAFNASITVSPGINPLVISSYNPEGDYADITYNIVFSTADLEATNSGKVK